ncbi:DUF924 family protein [Niveibacterium umoris]|uniref:Uncharacterized protein (DUF924 family) n=1 Tax=Niveibacterium umoris TaxID=1193620 RepID=A0A840BU91_9RHOO|nr:DUF924 family protein [Niveibacterium umoris]MBB4013927.1 uncharacterized protein (DUF924 family) [Niveibacterium umoris]
MSLGARAVLDFWFLPAHDPAHGRPRREWFAKDDAFDASIARRFGTVIDAALAGGFQEWADDPQGALARIIVLDQFTRNVHRGTALAFAGDALALATAQLLIDAGEDRYLSPVKRVFAYLPFEHSESLVMQDRAVALFEALTAEWPGAADYLDYARRHREVIARFGRFPHRNAQLGRKTTEVERQFLAQPGSSF